MSILTRAIIRTCKLCCTNVRTYMYMYIRTYIRTYAPLQISHINAELEGMRSSLSSRQRELECTSVRLAQASQQKDMLMKTTELYEYEKRDLEERVSQSVTSVCYMCVH